MSSPSLRGLLRAQLHKALADVAKNPALELEDLTDAVFDDRLGLVIQSVVNKPDREESKEKNSSNSQPAATPPGGPPEPIEVTDGDSDILEALKDQDRPRTKAWVRERAGHEDGSTFDDRLTKLVRLGLLNRPRRGFYQLAPGRIWFVLE